MGHINDSFRNYVNADWKEALANGSLLTSHYDISALAAAGSVFMGFTTGPEPVMLQSRSLSTDSTLSFMELYEGGAYSGGVALDRHRHNFILDNTANLLADITGGVTIDTPGTSVWHVEIVGTKNTIVGDSADSPSFIFKPNTVYYYLVRNDAAQVHDYFFRFAHSIYN